VKLTPGEIAHCIASTKMPATEWPVAIAVALAESGGDTDALGVNDKGTAPTPAPVTWGSYDCGLWQVNNYWHGAKMVPGGGRVGAGAGGERDDAAGGPAWVGGSGRGGPQ
jgi:hypothetical protein